MRILIVLLTLTIVSCGINTEPQKDLTINETYPGPWRDLERDEIVDLTKTLVKYEITGCGEIYVRSRYDYREEYLVACTSDGENWTYYLVWSRNQKIMGPFRKDNTIKDPY